MKRRKNWRAAEIYCSLGSLYPCLVHTYLHTLRGLKAEANLAGYKKKEHFDEKASVCVCCLSVVRSFDLKREANVCILGLDL